MWLCVLKAGMLQPDLDLCVMKTTCEAFSDRQYLHKFQKQNQSIQLWLSKFFCSLTFVSNTYFAQSLSSKRISISNKNCYQLFQVPAK